MKMQRHSSGLAAVAAAALAVTLAFGAASCAKKSSVRSVVPGSSVTLSYALAADNAAVVPDDRPETMKLKVGEGKLPSELEKALIGMPLGSARAVALKPEQGFGPLRKELVVRVPRASLPAGELREGALLGTGGFTARVVRILDDGTVILDRNHPLAGKNLLYKVRVVSID